MLEMCENGTTSTSQADIVPCTLAFPRPHQPARRNWSRHCSKARWKEKYNCLSHPSGQAGQQKPTNTRKGNCDPMLEMCENGTKSSSHADMVPCTLDFPRPHQPARRNRSRHCSKAQWKEKYNCLSHPSGQAGQQKRTNTRKGNCDPMLEMCENGTTSTSQADIVPCTLDFPRPHQPARRNWSRHCSKAQWKEKYNCLSHPSGQAGQQKRTNTRKGNCDPMLEMCENGTMSTSHAGIVPCTLDFPRPHQPARRNWSGHCSKAQWKEKYKCLSHPSGQAGQQKRTNTRKGNCDPMLEMCENGTTSTSQVDIVPCTLDFPRPHQPARRNWSRHCSKAQWKEKYNCLSHPSGQAGQQKRTNTRKGNCDPVIEMCESGTTSTSHADIVPCTLDFPRPHQPARRNWSRHCSKAQWKEKYNCLSHPSGQAGQQKRTNTRKGNCDPVIEMCENGTTSTSQADIVPCTLDFPRPHQPARRNWSRHCSKAQWKEKYNCVSLPVVKLGNKNERIREKVTVTPCSKCAKTGPCQLRTQASCHAPWISLDHISQPVAIGLDTARKLSGRRSTIAYLIPVVKLGNKNERIREKAIVTPCSKCAKTGPRQLRTQT